MVATTDKKTSPVRIAEDGLRYDSKPIGSEYSSFGSNYIFLISCVRCSKHRPRNLGVTITLGGQKHFQCQSCTEDRAARKLAKVAAQGLTVLGGVI